MFVNLQVMEKDGKSNLEEVVSIDSKEDTTPKIRMEFDSEEEAYLYYNTYAGYVGFSIHRDWLKIHSLKMLHFSMRYSWMLIIK